MKIPRYALKSSTLFAVIGKAEVLASAGLYPGCQEQCEVAH